jgi:outer membrane protein assembly factor BamA
MRLVLIFILFNTTHCLFSQSYEVNYTYLDKWPNKKLPDSIFKNRESLDKYLNGLQLEYFHKGYLTFSVDTIKGGNEKNNITFHVGPKFKSANISYDSNELVFLRRQGVFPLEFKLTASDFQKNYSKIADAYLNQGYPFVKIELIDCSFQNENNLVGKLNINRGERFEWGKINIKGDSAISESFISNLSGIRTGRMFNESLLRDMQTNLSFISFLEPIKSPDVLFYENKVDVFLYLKSKPVSSINGAIGLQPNPNTQKMAFTGQVQLKLLNALKKAELIELNWRSIQPGTQNLFINNIFPYLFKSKFGFDAKFNLYKRDSSFLEIKGSLGITYQLKNNFVVKGFYSYNSNRILSTTLSNSLLSTSISSYGISVNRKKLDYLPNPRKGISFVLETSIGNRKIEGDSETKFSAKGLLSLEKYTPIAKRHILKFGVLSDWIYNENTFANERIRFGGLNSFRGFNEEELFATSYSVAQIEYRFLLDKNSNLFTFFNQAWYEDNAVNTYINDMPFGFGAGLSFGTKLGIFSITYALGKQFDNPIQFNQGKIHIGYISYF